MTDSLFIESMGSIPISKANLDDVDDVHRLLSETAKWLHHKGIQQWLLPKPRSLVVADIEAGNVYVVKSEKELIATVSLSFVDTDYWPEKNDRAMYVHRIAVKRSFSKFGIGEKMMRWSIAFAKNNGCEFVRLDCARANPFLISWYKSLGFTHIDDAFVNSEVVARFEMKSTTPIN